MAHAIKIRRDRTFEYRGEQYRIIGGGPSTPNAAYGYLVERMSDGMDMDGFFRYSDIYDHFDDCEARGLPVFESEEIIKEAHDG